MRQSKTCGEPCAVCDGCLEAHDAALKARVAELEKEIKRAKLRRFADSCRRNGGVETFEETISRQGAGPRGPEGKAMNFLLWHNYHREKFPCMPAEKLALEGLQNLQIHRQASLPGMDE